MPGRKLAVERDGIRVPIARLTRYVAATRPSVAPEVRPGSLLPPTYPSTWETAIILDLLAMEGVPFPSAGVIHLRSEIIALRSMRVDDRFRCRMEVDGIEPHARGWRLLLRARNWNQAGQLCQENATEILVRGPRREGAAGNGADGARNVREVEDEGDDVAWRSVAAWEIPANAGLRYARASGDYNPIHLWAWTARPLGFDRPILHGHCALAMIARLLGNMGSDGAGMSPRRVEARFRRPLLLPCAVRLEVLEVAGGGGLRFRLVEGGGAASGVSRSYVEGSGSA